MSYLSNLVRTARFFATYGRVLGEHLYARRLMRDVVTETERDNDGSATADVYLNARWYMVQGIWACGMFKRLTGAAPTADEKRSYAYLGATLGVGDAIVDESDVPEARIRRLAADPDSFVPEASIEALYLRFYRLTMASAPPALRPEIEVRLREAWEPEIESQRQFDPDLPAREVDRIIEEKGGRCGVLFRVMVDHPLAPGEAEAAYAVGVLGQVINDAKDLYKDLQAGLRTSATVRSEIGEVVALLERQKRDTFIALKRLPHARADIDTFIFTYYAFLVGIYAHLQHLSRACGGRISHGALRSLPEEAAAFKHSRPADVAYLLPRLLQYDYDTAERPYPYTLGFTEAVPPISSPSSTSP